ncbi:MAG: TolC family protein [Treponema sp.]|nr:TolC family protein [Treponema sp.]
MFASEVEVEKSEIRKITVDDAVILAADNNVSLKRQRLSLELLEKKNAYSWNGISPSVSLSGSYSDGFISGTFSDGSYTDLSDSLGSGNWSLGASVRLSLSPSLYTTIKNARLNYESGIVSYEEAVRSVEVSVRKLFYGLIYTKESIALKERNMETSKIRYENNRDKFSRGQLSELDLLQSQYNYESQKPSLESAIISYENDLATFKQTLGLSQNEEIELVGSLSDFVPPDDLVASVSVEDLPAVKKLEASIEAQKNSLAATRFSAWGPSITASYSYNVGGKAEADAVAAGKDSLSLSVGIPLDGYLPWSSGSLSIEAQKASLKDLELQLENTKTASELEIKNSIKKIYQAKSQMAMLEQNVDIAQRTYDMTQRAYNVGSKDLLTLQNASDSLMSARLTQQQQLYSLICSILDLENTLGIPFGSLGNSEEGE